MLSVTIVLLRAVYTLFKRPLGCPKHIYSIVKVKMVVKEAVNCSIEAEKMFVLKSDKIKKKRKSLSSIFSSKFVVVKS